MVLSIIEGKSEFRRYKFENLLIANIISRQQNYSSIASEKSEMWRYKFENLFIAFKIIRHHNWFSIVEGKSKMWRNKFEKLLTGIAFSICKQRKIMSSQNQPECAFYTNNRPKSKNNLKIKYTHKASLDIHDVYIYKHIISFVSSPSIKILHDCCQHSFTYACTFNSRKHYTIAYTIYPASRGTLKYSLTHYALIKSSVDANVILI